MANTPSAIKRVRSNNRKRQVNRLARARTRTAVKQVLVAIDDEQTPAEIQKAAREAASALDKAVQKGVVHKNAAARRKSRLAKKAAAAGK